MESQMSRPYDHEHNRHPQHLGTHQGEEEDHQEKSVLKKVKEKAKKIRNKLTKHGHGHEHDHHDPDEEDDEEDEDPEVHGATTIGSRPTGQGDILKVPMVKFGDMKAAPMHDHDPKVPHLERTDPMKEYVPAANQRTRQIHSIQPVTLMHDDVLEPRATMESLIGHDQIPSQRPKVDNRKRFVMGEAQAPHAPQNTPQSSLGDYKSNSTDPSQTFLSGKEGHLGQSREQAPVSYLGLGEHRSNAAEPSPNFVSMSEGHLGQSRVHAAVSSLGGDHRKTNVADPRQTSVTGKEGHSGQTRVHLHHRGLDDRTSISSRGDHQKTNVTDPSDTFATGKEGHFGQSGVNLDRPRGLGKDPYAPEANPQAFTPPNYQTKVTDPTDAGGEEIGITPILHSFDKMNIHGGDTTPSNQGSSYTDKVLSATSAVADKAISAKNAAASKLGYGGGNEDVNPHAYSPANDPTNTGNLGTRSHDQFSPEHPSNQGGSYTEKISSATSAIADKAISAKDAVASKLGYGGGNNDQHEFVKPQASSYQTTGQNLSTAENPSNQGSYTGKISSVTHAIADTAISAKNVVASKLGYGGDTDQQQHGDQVAIRSGSAAPEQGKGITAAVTEKLTPVYEKVAGAGSTVMSKFPGGAGTVGKEEVNRGTATTGVEYDKAGENKGVSVKGYFSEKWNPREEDRALSEVISETLHKRKAEQPVGKVTETVEVTRRLVPDDGVDDVQQSSYGKVVAETLEGAVGSLFGKADQTTTSPQSLGSSTGTEGFSSSGSGLAERRGHGSAEQRRLHGK